MSLLAILALLLQEEEKKPLDFIKSVVKQIEIGAQARVRAEYRDPIAYSSAALAREDDDIYLSRIRIHLKFSVTDDIDLFVQPQDSRIFGEEASISSNEKNLDLHQGWVEFRNLFGEPLSVKLGRQEFQYGDGRLVSPLDWHVVGRAWDGGRIRYAPDKGWVEAFYTVIKEGNGAEDDQDFFGLYASCAALENHEFDLYVFGRLLRDNAFTDELGRKGDLRDATIGARGKGKVCGFDYSLEGCLQTGDFVDDDLSAWAAAATLGYTLDLDWKPRLGIEVTFATGDEDPTDGERQTFDPLFPFGHSYQGLADIFAWKNGLDLAVYLRVQPLETLSVHLDFHNFWLDEERDGWYAASGAVIRRDPTGAADRRVGNEIDLHVKFNPVKYVKLWGGWSHFFAGPFVEDTGRDRDMDWFFLQMTLEF